MKKGKILVFALAILAVLCLTLVGCKQEPEAPPAPTTGTLTIYNSSSYQQDTITKVKINVTGQSTPVKEETVQIKFGESKAYTLAAGGYTVVITDNSNYTYTGVASVSIGGSASLSFNGDALQ